LSVESVHDLRVLLWIQLNSTKVVAVGPGDRVKEGKPILVALKEGDHVLLPEHGGFEVKLTPTKEYVTHFTIVLLLLVMFLLRPFVMQSSMQYPNSAAL
jgi:hypothetical protein